MSRKAGEKWSWKCFSDYFLNRNQDGLDVVLLSIAIGGMWLLWHLLRHH